MVVTAAGHPEEVGLSVVVVAWEVAVAASPEVVEVLEVEEAVAVGKEIPDFR